MIDKVAGRVEMPRLRLVVLAVVACCIAGLGSLSLGVPSSSAVPKTVDRFVGGLSGGVGGAFAQARDAAVNETGAGAADPGDVYVSEQTGNRVSVFSASGAFKRAFGFDVIAAGAAGDLGSAFEVCVVAAACKNGVNTGAAGGQFNLPQVVVVDQDTGNVYVSDRQNQRIQVFDAGGTFLRTWGFDVAASGPGNTGTGFEICVAADGDICKAGVSGAGIGQISSINASPTLGLAITPGDGNPTTGSVYLADTGNRRVNVYNLDGASPSSFGSATQFTGSDGPRMIAVDSRGIVYVTEPSTANSGEIERYDTTGINGAVGFLAPIAATAANLGGAGTTLGLEVNPDSDGGGSDEDVLFVLRDPTAGNSVVRQFGPANDPGLTAAPTAADEVHMATAFGTLVPNGLGLNSATGTLYVTSSVGTACGGTCGGVFALDDDGTGTAISAADVGAADATSTTIEVVGTVDPDDGLVRYRFEHSPDGVNYQQTAYTYLSGTGPVQVSNQLTGLQPNSLYRVRLRVEKIVSPTVALTDVSAEALTFTDAAAPGATTIGTSNRTATAATLRGLVDPKGSPTTYRFEYGLASGGFDNVVPVPDAPAGTGNGETLVQQSIGGLMPNTSYQYRLVATSNVGTTNGQTLTFTTEPAPSEPGPLASRAYELVSPAYKTGGIGLGDWGPSQKVIVEMGFAAPDGERFAAHGSRGSMLLDGEQAYANDWAFADRIDGQQGWVSHSPFTHPGTAGQLAKGVYPHAATDDLSRLAWRTNNSTIGIFPETLSFPGDFNPSFIASWEGRWELFGPTDLAQVSAGTTRTCDIAFSGDGSRTVCTTALASGIAGLRGLAGANDPTSTTFGDLVAGRSVYVGDSSGELADNFPATGARALVNVCSVGTEIPNVDGSANLTGQGCVDQPGRDDLVSSRGATQVDVDVNAMNGVRGTPENVVSEDGARVFFMSPDPQAAGVPNGTAAFCTGTGASTVCPTQLFVRQDNGNGTFTTRWISRADDGLFGTQDATLTGTVRFERATPDGDKVLFRTNSPLTSDDRNATGSAPVITGNASNDSWDLYLYDFPDDPGADPGDGQLTRVSAGPGGSGDCNVQPVGSPTELNAVAAARHMSDDGSRIVLTCAAPLPNVPPAGSGTITQPAGSPTTTTDTNLYSFDVARPAAQRYRFIARVPRQTTVGVAICAGAGVGPTAPLVGDNFGELMSNCVRGTLDGSFLTFWTAGRLTADDPNATTADIYAYDVDTDELTRITAPRGGVGGTYFCVVDDPFSAVNEDSQPCYGDNGYDMVEATEQRAPKPMLGVATDPLVPGDRMAFFQSKSRLVPQDTDSLMDVYQWRNGDLTLLSTGDSDTFGAYYRGNDRTGRNVYMVTQDRLTWQDFDSVFDAYTVRVGGGVVQPHAPVVCDVLGGGCGAGGSTAIAVPSSETGSSDLGQAGDVSTAPRAAIALLKPSRKARVQASRTGVLSLRVRSSGSGRVDVVARGRIGRRLRRVGSVSRVLSKPGTVTVRIRLSRVARERLRGRRALRLAIQLRAGDTRPKTLVLMLPGGVE